MNEKKLGDILREKRESLNLTIEEVANMTKLKKSTILALEKGDYKDLQEPVYIRGFLKIYASALDLDYKQLYPKLEEELRLAGKLSKEEEKPKKKKFPFLIIAILVITILVLYRILFWSPKVETPKNKTEVTQPVVIPPKAKPEIKVEKPEVQEPVTEKVITPAKKEVNLEIKALGYSWLRVIVDDKKVFEGFINTGETYSWKGEKKIVIRAGNAGAVNVISNGKDIGVLGKKGEVVEREFLPE